MNPLKTIGGISQHITSLKSGTGTRFGRNSGFGWNSDDGIPPWKIGIFDLFDRGMSDFSDRTMTGHEKVKSETENPEGNRIFEMLRARIVLKLKKLGAEVL